MSKTPISSGKYIHNDYWTYVKIWYSTKNRRRHIQKRNNEFGKARIASAFRPHKQSFAPVTSLGVRVPREVQCDQQRERRTVERRPDRALVGGPWLVEALGKVYQAAAKTYTSGVTGS